MVTSDVGKCRVGGKVTECKEALLLPILFYGSDTMVWGEKGRSRIRAVQISLGEWIVF